MIVVAFILFAALIFAWLAAPGGKPETAPPPARVDAPGLVPSDATARA
jgi:hypothetical protein